MKPHLRLTPIAALAAVLAGAVVPAQETTPVFPREIEMVTVDVVVTDKEGRPVTGLSRDDFTILDEGERQEIVSFDVITAGAPPEASVEEPAAEPPRPRIVTNEGPPPPPGRTFVVVFDNLNMSPLNAQRAKAAVVAFLDKGLRDGDRVMLAATGGAWWTTRLPEGREDLVAVLKGLDGRRSPAPDLERMTDFEAMRIYQYSDYMIARRVQDRFERYGVSYRVKDQRQIDQDEIGSPGRINLMVDNRAAETYMAARTRNRATLGALERMLKPLQATRDRKSLVLVSEGFVYDPNEPGFRRVVEAARRANAVLYFVDTRGLADLPGFYGAQFGAPIDERNLLAAVADTTQDSEGAASLARDTGGFTVADTNDLEAGIVRIAREQSSYYLIGYNPGAIAHDGRFRRIEVKVSRPELSIRARRGYYAPSDVPSPTTTADHDPQLQYGLDSPTALDGIPLRMTAYALDPVGTDSVRVLVAADADLSKVEFQETEGKALASIDTLAVVARRENAEIYRRDQKVDLERRPGALSGPSWYTMVREFDLPPGAYQAKVVVRDPVSKRLGTVSMELDVPPLDTLRLSSVILTDSVQQSAGGPPMAVLLARRTFSTDRPLYCRFDVYGADKDPGTGLPYVTASHVLRRDDGVVVSRSAPTEIAPTSLGSLLRMMQIPLEGLRAGAYDLELEVRDRQSGRTVRTVEPFTIVPGQGG